MPTAITSTTSTRTTNPRATQKPRSHVIKKTRIIRRRGRAKDGIESDDEIVREVGTDSESDNEMSSNDSATEDSDTEPASEDVAPHSRDRIHTPATSQSPESLDKGSFGHLDEGVTPFFAPTNNWSEMVSDEHANGPTDLPVIEFAEFDSHTVPSTPPLSRKVKKSHKKPRPVNLPGASASPSGSTRINIPAVVTISETLPAPVEQLSDSQRRQPGQTARQAYQQRLESDPSYVPKVGGFWSHDDRLMDKDLRSLSGWWRGRWQGRGRGFGMRGAGRGGFSGLPAQPIQEDVPGLSDVPPIEREWTHDGFEEMKQRDEQRRAPQQPQQPSNHPLQGGGSFRGGRGGSGRGRGFARGGFTSSPTGPPAASPSHQFPKRRVWFSTKPDPMWTKHHDGFLFYETAPKPRSGHGQVLRVKLPGSQGHLVKARANTHTSPAKTNTGNEDIFEPGSITVNLPKQSGKQKALEDAITAEDIPLDEVFKVRLQLVAANPIPLPEPSSAPKFVEDQVIGDITRTTELVQAALPEPSVRSQLEQLSIEPNSSDPVRRAQTEQAVLRKPGQDEGGKPDGTSAPATELQTSIPSLPTAYNPSPIPQGSPSYGSPYTFAASLPPGLAVNQHGMPYELATGRPVYLQAPPMYNPRPLLHSHLAPPTIPFISGPMHHPSALSPDFLSHAPSHTPPLNGFIDPSTGTPIFSFPRQTARIEIRAPTEDSGKSSGNKPSARGPSALRTTAPTFEPSRSQDGAEQFFPSLNASAELNALPSYETTEGIEDESQASHQHHPGMMTYPHYQQYYYPETYGYPQYVDMSQVGQYEMYSQPQGTVYY